MSNNIKIYKMEDIDLTRIIYSRPVSCKKNKSSILISYNDPEKGRMPFLLRIPSLYLVDGIKKKINSSSITHELMLLLQCKSHKSTTETVEFFESLDRKFVNDIKDKNWDQKNKSWKKIVRKSENNDHLHQNGGIKIKFIKSDDFETKVYTPDGQIVDQRYYDDVFGNSCYVKTILEFVSLWKNNDNVFGLYVRPHQICVNYHSPPVNVLQAFSFPENSEESDNKTDNMTNRFSDTSNTSGISEEELERINN